MTGLLLKAVAVWLVILTMAIANAAAQSLEWRRASATRDFD